MATERTLEAPAWAARVRELLDAQGRRYEWLAGVLKVHPSTFSRFLHGERLERFTPALKAETAEALGVPFDWLFGESDGA